MKIIDISTHILRVPLGTERFFSSQCAFPERNSFLVRIETDCGLVGWGEGGQYGPPEPVEACVQYVLKPRLIGRDPRERTKLWNECYAHVRDFGSKGSYIEAISALDIAMWDIMGQSVGLPIYMLLGGAVRKEIHAYATGCYYRGEDYLDFSQNLPMLRQEVRAFKELGFTMLKCKIGLLSIEEDIVRVKTVREELGPNFKIFVDCNHAYNGYTALRVGKELEKLGVIFMEEPVPPEDFLAYKMLKDRLNLAVAGGEAEYTRYGFMNLIGNGCVDILQPDLGVCGGLSEWQNILTLAHSNGIMVIPHVWGSGIALATALHAVANIPLLPHTANPIPMQNEPVVEFDKSINPLRDELLNETFEFSNGKLKVPTKPGLGISINEDKLREYSG